MKTVACILLRTKFWLLREKTARKKEEKAGYKADIYTAREQHAPTCLGGSNFTVSIKGRAICMQQYGIKEEMQQHFQQRRW